MTTDFGFMRLRKIVKKISEVYFSELYSNKITEPR